MLPAIKSQRLRMLLEHYLEVRGDRRMPARRDVDAARLGPVLPIIWVSAYEAAAGTFRYRLAGEEVNRVWGMSISGRLLSDFVLPDRFPRTNEAFLKVMRQGVALITSGPIYLCADRIAMGERLVLPLADDGTTGDGLIGATTQETVAELNKVSMSEQVSTFVPVDELCGVAQRAVGAERR